MFGLRSRRDVAKSRSAYVWHALCDLYEADKLFVEWYGGLTSFSRPISWDMPQTVVFRRADVAEIDRRREQSRENCPGQERTPR